MHVTSLHLNLILIYSARKAEIALLLTKKAKILAKYSDFLNIFIEEKTLILLEIINLNQYIIKLQEN